MKHEIRGFRGVFSFLSNFYPCTMLFEDYRFTSAEAAFQSAKCYHLSDAIAMQGMTAKEAKRKGRTVRMRRDWEQVKVQVMRNVLRAKFDENPSLSKRQIDRRIENRDRKCENKKRKCERVQKAEEHSFALFCRE